MASTSGTGPQCNMRIINGGIATLGFRVVWSRTSVSGTKQTVKFTVQGISTPIYGAASSNMVVSVRGKVRYNSGGGVYQPNASWGNIASWSETFNSGDSFNIALSVSCYYYGANSNVSPTYVLPVLASAGSFSSITNPITAQADGVPFTVKTTSGTNVTRNLIFGDGAGTYGSDFVKNGIPTTFSGKTNANWLSTRQTVKSFTANASLRWMSGSTQLAEHRKSTTINIPQIAGLGIQSVGLGDLTLKDTWKGMGVKGISSIVVPNPTTDTPKYWSVKTRAGKVVNTNGDNKKTTNISNGATVLADDHGKYDVSFVVTDSRGYNKTSPTKSITIQNYIEPKLSNVSVKRTEEDNGTQLINNGYFDSGMTNINVTGTAENVTIKKDENSNNYLNIDSSNSRSYISFGNFNVKAGTKYTYSQDFSFTEKKFGDSYKNTVIYIRWLDSDAKQISVDSKSPSELYPNNEFYSDRWYRMRLNVTAPSNAVAVRIYLGASNMTVGSVFKYRRVLFCETNNFKPAGNSIIPYFKIDGADNINGTSTEQQVKIYITDSSGTEKYFTNIKSGTMYSGLDLDPLGLNLYNVKFELSDIVTKGETRAVKDTVTAVIDIPNYVPPSLSNFVINYSKEGADNAKGVDLNFSLDPSTTTSLFGKDNIITVTLFIGDYEVIISDPKNGFMGLGIDNHYKSTGIKLNAQITNAVKVVISDSIRGEVSTTNINISSLFVFVDFDRGYKDAESGLIIGGVGIGKHHQKGILDVDGDTYNSGVNYTQGGFVITGSGHLPSSDDMGKIPGVTSFDGIHLEGMNKDVPTRVEEYNLNPSDGFEMTTFKDNTKTSNVGKASLRGDTGLILESEQTLMTTEIKNDQIKLSNGTTGWITIDPVNGVTRIGDVKRKSCGIGGHACTYEIINGYLYFEFNTEAITASTPICDIPLDYLPRYQQMFVIRPWSSNSSDLATFQVAGKEGGLDKNNFSIMNPTNKSNLKYHGSLHWKVG